jgi:hypothetical protein
MIKINMNRHTSDLMRANPGFDHVRQGMVLRLPKEDPRVKRQRKIKRRERLYGKPEPPDSQTTTQSQPDFSQYESMLGMMEDPEQLLEYDFETALSQNVEDYDSGADLSGDGDYDWLNDPAFEDEMAELFAETALRMGLDVEAMMYEWGVSGEEGEPQAQPPKPPTRPPQKPAGEEGDDGAAAPSGISSPTAPALTKEQEAELKAKLKEMGLDESAMLYELGLSASDLLCV